MGLLKPLESPWVHHSVLAGVLARALSEGLEESRKVVLQEILGVGLLEILQEDLLEILRETWEESLLEKAP